MKDFWYQLPHHELHKILLGFLGLWPFEAKNKKRRNYAAFVVWTTLSSIILIEGAAEMKVRDTVVFYFTIAVIMWAISCLFLAMVFYMGEKSFRELYNRMESDWETIKDQKEIDIMQTFARRATSKIITYAGCSFVCAIWFLIANFLPSVYDDPQEYSMIFTSYSRHWIIFIDYTRTQVIIHTICGICYVGLLYISVLYVYLYCIEHTCGLFAIVSCRLKNLGKRIDSSDKVICDDEVIQELKIIISKYIEAIETCKVVERTFDKFLYILQVVGIMYTSIFGFEMQLSFNSKSIHLVNRVIPFIVVFLYYGFYLNYGGQQIIEHSNRIFMNTWYSTSWLSMSKKAKKILLIMMLRSSRCCTLKAGLMILALANFAQIVRACWSLGTVLSSTQKSRMNY